MTKRHFLFLSSISLAANRACAFIWYKPAKQKLLTY